MDYDQISSGIYSEKNSFYSLVEAASTEARRISRSVQEVAGTTACKGVQINNPQKGEVIIQNGKKIVFQGI